MNAIDDGLVTALYDDALQGGDWRPALERLRLVTGASDTALTFCSPATGALATSTTGRILTPEARAQYIAHFAAIDPKNAIFARRKSGYLFNDADHFDDGFVARDAFYQEYSRGLGSRHTLDMLLAKSPAEEIYLASVRGRRAGAFDRRGEALFRQASRHFVLVARLRERLGAAEGSRHLAFAALDSLNAGLIVLDEDGCIVVANVAATVACAGGQGLTLAQGRISAVAAPAARELAAAIAGVASAGAGAASVVRVPRPNRRWWTLSVVPLPPHGALAPAGRRGVLIVIADPAAAQNVRRGDLVALYGLTPAEAELAISLGAGLTLAEAAARRGVRISTARSQLLAILQKTGTARQSDLVRVLGALPTALLTRRTH